MVSVKGIIKTATTMPVMVIKYFIGLEIVAIIAFSRFSSLALIMFFAIKPACLLIKRAMRRNAIKTAAATAKPVIRSV